MDSFLVDLVVLVNLVMKLGAPHPEGLGAGELTAVEEPVLFT
ncbi:hypothetical protein CORAM0001_0912 [Corynebacterium amycolatum SK46]|nr:hypothetical protein CORAM0001_0912 [Corynebacterium amycolatum SK46]